MSSTPDGRGDASWGQHTTGPDELEAGPVLRANRFPRWMRVLGALLGLALVAGIAGFTAWRINASRPDQVVVSSAPKTPWAMTPPLRVGDYSRDANAADTPSLNPTTRKQTIASTYSRNGVKSVVLLMSRPEKDPKRFMADTGMNNVLPTDDAYCGTSVESNRDGCAIVRGNTAILVVDLVGLSRSDLTAVANRFGDELEG